MMRRVEKKLLQRLRAGDRDACVALIDGHYQQVYWYLLNLSRDEERAADLTQNTFAKAWKAIGGFRGDASFRTWLFSIARNEFLSEIRTRGRYPELAEYADLELVSDPAPSAEAQLVECDTAHRLREQVRALPGKYREVVALHYFERMSLRDVSRVLSIPAGTVKSRIHKALSLLKDRLDRLEKGYAHPGSGKTAEIGRQEECPC